MNLLLRITEAKHIGDHQYIGLCPCHDDRERSLSIKYLHNKKNPLIYCFAGCEFNDLVVTLKKLGCWNGGKERKNAFR